MHTTTPIAPATAEVATRSRRDVGLRFIPTMRAGTAMYVSIISPTTTLNDSANQGGPHRGTTTVDSPRARPMDPPHANAARRWCQASASAGRTSGGPGVVIANAKTALSRNVDAVIVAIRSTATTSASPRMLAKEAPAITWTFRSNMAAQIHIAGSTCTSVRRQFVTTSLSPSNNMAKEPTTNARGASQRCDRLTSRTNCSTLVSSASPIASTR